MPSFAYQAYNEEGALVKGFINAQSLEEAEDTLGSQGFIPVKIRQAKKDEKKTESSEASGFSEFMFNFFNPVKLKDVILFTKQLRTLLKAGVPLSDMVHVLEEQTPTLGLKKIIKKISDDVKIGVTFNEAFAKHPHVFEELYVGMVKAGESSGTLPDVLDNLTHLLEHEHKIKQDIKSALRYPKIVVFAVIGAFFFLLRFVFPKFIPIFINAKIAIPFPTRVCMALYDFIMNYWHVSLVFLGFGFYMLKRWLKTENGGIAKDKFILKIPIIGPVLQKAAMSRFSSIFSILQSAGVSVIEIIGLLGKTIGNKAISKEFEIMVEKLQEGTPISEQLKTIPYFTPMVVGMVSIGEQSGNLDEMLRQVTSHYDDEVNYEIQKMTDAITPIMMVGLTFVVGFFALAIMMPLWEMINMVK